MANSGLMDHEAYDKEFYINQFSVDPFIYNNNTTKDLMMSNFYRK